MVLRALLLAPFLTLGIVPPESYESWSAEEKLAWFKEHLDVGRGGSTETPWAWAADTMDFCTKPECIHVGGHSTRKDVTHRYECRVKGIHPTGLVAFVKAEWEEHNYTGMFKQADMGFVRWGFQYMSLDMYRQISDAHKVLEMNAPLKPLEPGMNRSEVDCDVYDCYNYTGGAIWDYKDLEEHKQPDAPMFMALKFFRGNVPSAAVHTGFLGYSSWEHLHKTYSNLLFNFGGLPNETDINSMSIQGTQRGTQWPGFTGLHDMAMYDQAGVLQEKPNFPYQIIFFPATKRAKIPESCIGEYNATTKAYNDAMEPGEVLYEIWAKDTLWSNLTLIGKLVLDSRVMMSADTDQRVFFYHPRFDRDLVLRPEFAIGCKSWWLCPVCPFVPEVCNPTTEFLAGWWMYEGNNTIYDVMGVNGEMKAVIDRGEHRMQRFFSCSHARLRAGAEWPQLSRTATVQKHGMRDDDPPNLVLDPRSQLLHGPDWLCDGDRAQWPQTPRTERRWTSPCRHIPVPDRSTAEPEFALEEGCLELPECSKHDGTWYSLVYPCRCGAATCSSGQLCLRHRNTCTSWGPYARAR